MHYVATFVVPYFHTLKVGLEAKSDADAAEIAYDEFCAGDITRAGGPCTIVSNEYAEDGDSGADLTPDVTRVLRRAKPERSVLLQQADEAAKRCVETLARAYARGKRNGGSVDWEDVDLAYEHARKAKRLLTRAA